MNYSKDNIHKTVVVFGAGIAGLTAAHFLNERGFQVTIIESLNTTGGLARSRRIGYDIPTEYSWRGFGPWYHNIYDVTKNIKFGKKSVYDTEFSRPVKFHLVQDEVSGVHVQKPTYEITNSWRQTRWDTIKFNFLMAQGFTCNKRSKELYSNENAGEYWKKHLSAKAAQTFSWTFGPFIGSDVDNVSRHHVSTFFQKNLFPGKPAPYLHYDEESSPPRKKEWRHSHGDGWLLLKRPSSESWFNPWTRQLIDRGVNFRFENKLNRINTDGKKITSVTVELKDGTMYDFSADYYISAINPFSMEKIVKNSSEHIRNDKELAKFKDLVSGGEHRQISFRFAFKEEIKFPDYETAIILTDSEFGITLFSQSQMWHKNVSLGKTYGEDVRTLWSGTTTIDSNSGTLYNIPKKHLTKKQFIEEVKNQVYRSKEFNLIIKNSNNGKELNFFTLLEVEVWHTWIFPKDNNGVITGEEPKWVNSVGSRMHHPKAETSYPNLFLSGSHVETNADLWSMEGACESGRRAADKISGHDTVIKQQENISLKVLKCADDALYTIGLPNILTVLIIVFLITMVCFRKHIGKMLLFFIGFTLIVINTR
jgi:uncharacterized protein with NAD-binding domain and iron-sulfur cluster